MKQYKFYWISKFIFSLFIFSCASNPQVSLSNKDVSAEKIFDYYCSNNKQIRTLSSKIEYIIPQLAKNLPVDEAAREQAYYSTRKQNLLKESLFSLSGAFERIGYSWNNSPVRQSSLEHKDLVEKVSAYEIRTSDFSSMQETALIMKPADSDKFVLFHAIQTNGRLRDRDNQDPIYISELKTLVDNFTLFEPLKYQEEAYSLNADDEKLIAIDSNDQQSISEAMKRKDEIWKRYIKQFTKIKEAKSNAPRIVNVELELDLNGFCRYGRNLNDLYSK